MDKPRPNNQLTHLAFSSVTGLSLKFDFYGKSVGSQSADILSIIRHFGTDCLMSVITKKAAFAAFFHGLLDFIVD
jgi:hypothetical protein